MIDQLRKSANHWVVALGIVILALLSGCQSPSTKFPDLPSDEGNMFHIGDMVTITAIPRSGDPAIFPPHAERIGEDGKISLLYLGQITAAGKTASQLQKEIHDLYVPSLFPELNVTVQGNQRYFYVDGEVRLPGQKEYPGEMTVVRAISVAGGFTDFAKRWKVQLTHGNHTQTIDVDQAIKDPRHDLPVFPGDRINVPRRVL